MTPASRLVLLLPERRRFAGQAPSAEVAAALGRADALPLADFGERAQLLRHFSILPRGWPMAAITRQWDAGDAQGSNWLRADPVFIRPELMGARLMAWGNLDLDAAQADELLAPLRPLFGDAGFPISRGAGERWYLQLPSDVRLPEFALPADALGGQLLAHLPEGDEGRRWRVLGNEAQIILHNHPRNAARIAEGKLPVNSLWFWGGGRLPDSVQSPAKVVLNADDELQALAALAGLRFKPAETGDVIIDLRRERDWRRLEVEHLLPGLASLRQRHARVQLDFADGAGFRMEPGQRWRFLRRPLTAFDA